jgi:hypothetical protein
MISPDIRYLGILGGDVVYAPVAALLPLIESRSGP